jgi:hypothetical protein
MKPLFKQADGLKQTLQTFEGIEVNLDRDDHVGAGHEGVEHEQPQRWRTIDDAHIVVVGNGTEPLSEHEFLAEAFCSSISAPANLTLLGTRSSHSTSVATATLTIETRLSTSPS